MIVACTILGGLLLWSVALLVNRRRVASCDGSGDPRDGIVVFVEPVRWLFIIWGFAPFCRGLRRAGERRQVRLFRWSSSLGALLVIPDLMRRGRLERRARRLARFIDQLALLHPGVEIGIVGYSSGGYIALEACKHVSRGTPVGCVVLLAASASPSYAWEGLGTRTAFVHNFHSVLDVINMVGPSLFGSNDRKWGPGCGAVGFRSAPSTVRQRAWTPADVRLGYLGDHFTITSPAFVATHVAPILC